MSEDESIAANGAQRDDHDGTGLTRRTFARGVGAGALALGIGATASGAAGAAERSRLRLDLHGLPDLSSGHYEGWAIFGGEKVSTGTFTSGGTRTTTVDRDLADADRIAITIEPDDDPSPTPSGVVVLVGAVEDGAANLSFPVDVGGVGGSYILATPTDGSGNAKSGVWFLEPGKPPAPSLDLPDLSGKGWTYEGWIVHGGRPISTGRFDDPAAADGSAAYAGATKSPPPFPGADLIANAPDGRSFPTDLTDGKSKVVISIEPDVDGTDPTGPGPFAVKPLVDAVPADGSPKTSYELDVHGETVPSGTARVNPDGPNDPPTIGVDLSVESVAESGTATATLSLSRAPNGVAGFAIDVTSADPGVVAIEDASLAEAFVVPEAEGITVGADGGSVRVEGVDLRKNVESGATEIELATITLSAAAPGESTIAVETADVDADDGRSVAVRTNASRLTVRSVEPIAGTLPTDPDGDGEYEDLNANGTVDFDDVVTYFQYKDEPAITDHVPAYDYNDNGKLDFDDVVALFEERSTK